jgi:2-polyprenyl-3-methyl-5-hydroxy-6-metoxy-1,4-benzoquinol methylase
MNHDQPVSAAGTDHDRDERRRDELVERLFGALLGGMELLSIDVGRRLGLYRALHEGGALSDAELAQRSGIAQRYAAEWLEQQAVAGILEVAEHAAEGRRYALPAPHADVLVVEDHPAHLMGAAPSLSGLAVAVPAVTEAYRHGNGVPYAAFGAEIRHGIGSFNRPMFTGELAAWVHALPDVAARLDVDGARVLDLGCGTGWSSIALAGAFHAVLVHGVDLDDASIEEARQNAAAAGVADRVTFDVSDAAEIMVTEPVALACVFEALHDMGRPIEVLRRARAALAPGGAVLIGDERVAPEFTAPGDDLERFMYGWSVLHCVPATLAEPDHAIVNGTVLRESTVHRWAKDAGFTRAQTLPIDNDFWRFYRLDT